MKAIRFTDPLNCKAGVKLFQHHPEAVSIGDSTTYYVTERGLNLLEEEHIPFEEIQHTLDWLTEETFADMRRSLEDIHNGGSTTVNLPFSVKKLAEIARRKGLM